MNIKEFSKDYRPVLILSSNLQNEFSTKVIVVPLTTNGLDCIEEFEVLISKSGNNRLEQDSKALFDSLFAINKNLRLQYCLGSISKQEKEKINQVLLTIFELD